MPHLIYVICEAQCYRVLFRSYAVTAGAGVRDVLALAVQDGLVIEGHDIEFKILRAAPTPPLVLHQTF